MLRSVSDQKSVELLSARRDVTMTSSLPPELWLKVFSFLSWKDKLSVRGSCSYFRNLLDKSRPLWRGFCVVLRHFSRYNRAFWRSLAQRHVGSVLLRSGRRTHVRQLSTWLPDLRALRLDGWGQGTVDGLDLLPQLQRLSVTSCSTPLKKPDFLFPLSGQLTHLSLCNVPLSCSSAHLLAAVSQLRCLTSLVVHHDGSVRVPTLGGVLAHLSVLTHLSWTMITYKSLSPDFFCPAHPTGSGTLPLSDLQLLDYDAVVTPDVLRPLSRLQSLSVFHMYSVPGPVCHLRTWLSSLPGLRSLSVHGGHPLAAYASALPPSLRSLTLCVDLELDDLQLVSSRLPGLEHLHLEPWSSSAHLVRLLPKLFPHLTTLRIRHHHVSDADFLSLQQLRRLRTLEVLDSYHSPDPADPSRVVSEASPRLLRLGSALHESTNHRVRVITSPQRDQLTCQCV